ncbi:MAG: DUF1631 domain-containing protein [Dokdonella sp.]|uniref:DUF1631 domain-containing protein n=2 Tax=Dokdonella sp. TaxID=2291710 RepID=UPI0025BE5579|nr:DUF1631 domain-containing protein [Dokdonella sp.]MBX3699839.1 DUF1631 domain-containing protein [Dokdonella sp.]
MTAANDNPNVVVLSPRQAPVDRLGDLLKLVRGVSLKRINALVGTLFENVDDALFDLAERAGSNAVQTEYFDGMREIRRKRHLVERLFHEQASRAFNDFAEGKAHTVAGEGPQPSAPAGGLSLVDDVELEESLAVSSMIAKAENRLQRTLYQVNQRLSVIVGGGKVDDANNPIGPAALANAFRVAVREFEVNVQVKLIVFKLFERYVIAGLEAVYDEVNIELIRAGVLPQVRHTVARNAQSGAGASPAAGLLGHDDAGEINPTTTAHDAQTVYDPVQAEVYHTLRALLASRRGPMHYGGEPAAGGFSATDLLSALTLLQASPTPPARVEAEPLDAAQIVQQIKQELLAQVGRLTADAKDKRVTSADEDTIDLVGMLFEYILRDRNLPAQMQALLGRLQIPYLKVGILDRHLFAQKTHPARRLLDLLADAGKSWSEESDRDHRLFDRVKATVETVLRDFDDDVGVFDREVASFSDFIGQNRKRADLAEQRAADAARGREKLQAARQRAAREILSRISDRNLPPIVHGVLSRPWANYLVLTLLRQGEESDEWRNALRFTDEFIWSAQPKTTDNELARLRALLPPLQKALRHGLTTVAYHEADMQRLLADLALFYDRVLAGQKLETKKVDEVIRESVAAAIPTDAAAGATADAVAPAAPASHSPVEEAVLDGTLLAADEVSAEPDADDEYLRAVKAIKPGSWIEFVDESGQRERAKLSWISPISAKYLFVNRRGLKVCDKTATSLAEELRSGSTTILEEVPLFDRALDAIVAKLRDAGGSEASASAHTATATAAAPVPPADGTH